MKTRYRTVLALVLFPAWAAQAAERHVEYFAVFMDGKKIGHATQIREVATDKVTHTETMQITIARMGESVTLSQSEKTIETPDGKPLGFVSAQNLGAVTQLISGTVADGTIRVTVSAMGQQKQQTLPWPEGAVMSEAFRQLSIKRGLKEGATYSAKVFVPSMLQAMEAKLAVGPARTVDLLGRVVKLVEVVTTLQSPVGQVVTTSYVDEEFNSLKTTVPMMNMMLEMIACQKAVALSPNDPVDLVEKNILRCPVAASKLAGAKSATYTLRATAGGKLGELVASDSQSVRAGRDGSLLVTVRAMRAPAGAKFPYAGVNAAALAALKPNRFVQSDRKEIIELSRKAVGDVKSAAAAAKRIEQFVHKYVRTKNLSVGYASALEAASSREGDCTEHAVLAAAMCRAAGIPARVVAGYVLVPKFRSHSDVFVGHAWVEAFIGEKWIPLDAARGEAGVGRLACSIGNGEPTGFFKLLTTLGRFEITKVTVVK